MDRLPRQFDRFTLRQLRLLVAIVEQGSLLRAGEAIGLTQPAVTRSLRELEASVGVPLFHRGNRGVTPTAYGKVLLGRARLALAQMSQAAEEIGDLAQGAGGRVAVGTLLAGSARLLPEAIDLLLRERPQVVVQVVEGTNDRLQPALARGELDLVVGRLSEFRHREGLEREALLSEGVTLVVRADHPLTRRSTSALAELDRWRWILPPPETSLRRQFDQAFLDAGLEPPPAAVESVSLLTNRGLLLRSDLVGVWPAGVAREETADGRLAGLPFPVPSLGRGASQALLGVSFLRDTALSPTAEAFLSALRRAAASV